MRNSSQSAKGKVCAIWILSPVMKAGTLLSLVVASRAFRLARAPAREDKLACNWFAAGFCKYADKCAARSSRCRNNMLMQELRDSWLEGRDPPFATAPLPSAAAGIGSALLMSPHGTSSSSRNEVECILVLDIEGGANDRPGEDEIIELPVAIVNLRTRREEARFHRFIRPSGWDTGPLSNSAQQQTSLRFNPSSKSIPFSQAL